MSNADMFGRDAAELLGFGLSQAAPFAWELDVDSQGEFGEHWEVGMAGEATDLSGGGEGHSYARRIIAAESRGQTDARNPRSSAFGAAQFIESTWLRFAAANPALFRGMGREEILARRSDLDLNIAATEWYARDNTPILQRAGVPATAANLAMAHYLGPDGAVKLIQADPSTPMTRIFSSAAAAANPADARRTAGEIVERYRRRFGDAAPDLGAEPNLAATIGNQAVDSGRLGGTTSTQGTAGGADRRWVQTALNRLQGAGLDVDGIMGPATRLAIRAFQRSQGLDVDGIAGPRTIATLRRALGQGGASAGPAGGSTAGTRISVTGFRFDTPTLPAGAAEKLRAFASTIRSSQRGRSPIRYVDIIGHTDPVGTDRYNMALGCRRAVAVERELRQALGSTLARQVQFHVTSMGEKGAVRGDNARSRRVDLVARASEPSAVPRGAELCSIDSPRPRPSPACNQPELDRLLAACNRRFFDRVKTVVVPLGSALLTCGIGAGPILLKVARQDPKVINDLLGVIKTLNKCALDVPGAKQSVGELKGAVADWTRCRAKAAARARCPAPIFSQ